MPSAYGLPNCVGWYQAGVGLFSDAGTTPANQGDGVYQWSDQSGNNNHLLQTTAANRPICNAYNSALTSTGAPTLAPYGGAICSSQTSFAKSLLFDGAHSYLVIPNSLTLPATGCTVALCTRGPNFSPISFGTDGVNTVNYGWGGGNPQRMSLYSAGDRVFPAPTYLPTLTPMVHGFRASSALGETRLYMGTNQTSANAVNYFNFATTGGAVGRTLNLSNGGYGNYAFIGEISEIAIFSAPLTNTMMQSLLANMQTANRLRSDANTNQVVFVGDSLTAGGPGLPAISHCYPWVLSQQFGGAFKSLMIATPGATIAQQQTVVTLQVQPLDLTPFAVNVAVVCCGSNDLAGGARTAAQVQADLATLCTGLRTAGFKVILVTITLRSDGVGTTNAALWTAINTVNAGLRSTYTTYADALVDWAADARLTDPTNTAWFADQVHTTDAGDGVKASLVKPALDALLTPTTTQATLHYGAFYAGGRSFTGNYGNFVRT